MRKQTPSWRAMLGLREFSAVPLADYNQFIKKRAEFLVYSDRSGWILDNLIRDIASVRLLKLDKGRSLFLMHMRRSPE